MAVNFFLTDSDADISGYLRAKLGARSDNPHHVRAVTNTEAGPSSGVQITRTAAGTALAWITDPLSGVDLTAAAWQFHIWALESAAAANAALRFQVLPYTSSEQAAALDDNGGTELGTTVQDYARTSGNASVTTMADGDRLVFKILLDDATAVNMASGQTVTVSYGGQFPRSEGDSYIICPDTLALTEAMPSATRTRVRRVLMDTASTNPNLTDNEVDQAFESALRAYSKDRPRVVVGAMSGDGSAVDFRLPRLWIDGFSSIREIEYPAGEQTRLIVDENEYEILASVLGPQPTRLLHWMDTTPSSGTSNILVRYTTRHVHTDEMDSVYPDDFDALCQLAGSEAALALAAKMAASSDPVITSDSTNYRDGEQRWRSVAKALRERYEDHMGQGDATPTAASKVADWDTQFSWGRDFLFHGRRGR